MNLIDSEGRLLLETTKITSENLPTALAALQSCWKSTSLLWMHSNHFPVLPGLILNGWARDSEEAVSRFCRERNFSALLVRMEKPGQRWIRRRGGYTVSLEQIPGTVKALADEGLIAILLEPASPYSDLFSLTSACEVDAGKIDIEVVGPGFDASDVLRADVTPHERFHIIVDARSQSPWDKQDVRVSRTHVIDPESYRASVRRRLAKIGARLRNPAFPDEWMDPHLPASTIEALIQNATRHLRESGQTALLDHSDLYGPIPAELLSSFVNELLRLCKAAARCSVPWRTFSMAGTFLSKDRLVMWDFFPPGDHDTATLSNLTV